ncbi:MAG: S9 family peptidase [Flavobacteriales bacterium]
MKSFQLSRLILFAFLFHFAFPLFSQDKKLTNRDIWYSTKFTGSRVNIGESMQDGKHYSIQKRGKKGIEIAKYKYATGKKVDTIVTSKDLVPKGEKNPIRVNSYKYGPDEKKLLIATQTQRIYRRSSRSYYFIHDLETGETMPLADKEKGKQRLAESSPNGKKVGFVRKNNIFIKDLESGEEIQVTKDGKMNKVINGATDWVYEEEFAFTKGFYWSPKGSHIAYFKFNEDRVKEFQMPYYRDLYPEQYKFKYPKAGEKNSIVSVHMYNVKTQNSTPIDIGKDTNIYIPRIKWTRDNEKLCIMRMNRHQNHLEFLLTKGNETQKGKIPTKVMYEEKEDEYITITDDLYFMKNGEQFVWTNETDGYNHVYLYNMNGEKVRKLTKGEWDVASFEGVDEEGGYVYFVSAEVSPTDRNLYRVNLKGKKKEQLTPKKGQHSVKFSKGHEFFIDYYSNANTPRKITLNKANGELVEVLEDNQRLKDTLDNYKMSKKEFFSFKTEYGVKLNGWMIKPPDFDPNKEYPVYMNVYGGPGINTVNNSWGGRSFLWHQMLAQKGYIVVSVDNRGTGYRGEEFKKCTYKQLGKLETKDQIAASKYLGKKEYVDADRIGIQGWSYGGYMTLLCMTKGADHFKMGISIAPVTNWRFYDTIYTERFMRTPQENPEGYDDNSPINHVGKFDGELLLVHGAADDNVHFQNTMEFVDAMVKANKQFDLFAYPNRDHSIAGGTTRLHLFTKMTEFVEENL